MKSGSTNSYGDKIGLLCIIILSHKTKKLREWVFENAKSLHKLRLSFNGFSSYSVTLL